MGHLVNSNSLRIGWSLNWIDSWYIDDIYYSEFLYLILRTRFFLLYLFSSKKFEDIGYFYSHFELYLKYNKLFIYVYFYDGFVEGVLDNLLFKHSLELRKVNSNFKTKKPNWTFEPWKLFIILNWIHQFRLDKWPLKRVENLILALNFMNLKALSKSFLKIKRVLFKKAFSSKFIFFYTLFLNLKILISNNYIKRKSFNNLIFSRFIYCIAWAFWNKGLFFYLRLFLSYVIEKLTNLKYSNINFFALTSYCINAKFLSRYIGSKLKQNYTVMELLNPIKRELFSVSNSSKYPLSSYLYNINKDFIIRNHVIVYKVGLLKILFIFFFLYSLNIFINFL